MKGFVVYGCSTRCCPSGPDVRSSGGACHQTVGRPPPVRSAAGRKSEQQFATRVERRPGYLHRYPDPNFVWQDPKDDMPRHFCLRYFPKKALTNAHLFLPICNFLPIYIIIAATIQQIKNNTMHCSTAFYTFYLHKQHNWHPPC